MQQLIEVIKLIADKYIEHVNLIITKDNLILEYFIFREEERDLYKTLEIEEFEDKLKVVFFPERITRLTNLKEIEDIIETLEKQSKVKTFSKTEVDYIKQKYPVGTKVKLIKMYDLFSTIPTGTEGTIERIDDIGTLHIKWNNGSELGLVIGTDEFEVIGEDKICANCGKAIVGYPAISRKDNKTEICSNCGSIEALNEFKKYQGELKI